MQWETADIIPPETLLMAYRNGIFPMAVSREDDEIFWMEPKKRAIIPLDGFHCSKSLRKVIEKDHFKVTLNKAFSQVIAECAAPRIDYRPITEGDSPETSGETWINARIAKSYQNLHEKGLAQSVECWQEGQLVGGLYGVSFDRVFCGESMFSRADNASKVALAWLVGLMRRAGYRLLDCQFMTPHLSTMGAIEITQKAYCKELVKSRGLPTMGLASAYSAVFSEAAASTLGEGAGTGEGEAAGLAPSFASDVGFLPSPGKVIMQSLTQTS